jgi:hypothetical protein
MSWIKGVVGGECERCDDAWVSVDDRCGVQLEPGDAGQLGEPAQRIGAKALVDELVVGVHVAGSVYVDVGAAAILVVDPIRLQ